MIKHCLIALVLAGLVYAALPVAVAQDNGNAQQSPPSAAPEHEHGHRHMDPEKRAAMLTKRLKLNADQHAKVVDILKSEQSQMETLHSDSSMSQDDRRSKMMDLHKSSDDQIRALLDPDQQKKFDEMQSEHQDSMHGHGDQNPGGSSNPPQQ
jgi:periplasmic protein CpxP/Spy